MIDIESVKLKKADELRAIADELITIHPIETKTFKFNTASLNPESSTPDFIPEFCTQIAYVSYVRQFFVMSSPYSHH